MPKTIFRQEAVERMSSPEQLDELMPVTSPRGWIALAGLSVLLLLGIVWGFIGKIETTVDGSGVLVRPGAVFLIDVPAAGIVKEVHVDANQKVKAGDKLITLTVDEPGGKTRDEIIRSLDTGRVLDVNVIKFDPVKKGASLLTMDSPEKPLDAVLYIPAKDGYKVQKNMPVQVFPVTGGAIFGKVKSAGRFPASRTAMQRSLQNPDWSNEVLQQGPVLEVIVELPNDADVQEVLSGTPCMAVITISTRKPISFVLPIFDTEK
jgi:Biotin-lipoyl like